MEFNGNLEKITDNELIKYINNNTFNLIFIYLNVVRECDIFNRTFVLIYVIINYEK